MLTCRDGYLAVVTFLLMDHSDDTNAAIWQSGEAVQAWAAQAQVQERYRAEHRRFMAALLPFGPQETFTFLDLGAGTGAASRTILDVHPGGTAILADFSAEMMRAGEREMRPYSGRYRYVEFDMSAGGEWPAAIPVALDAVVTSMCVHHLPDERKRACSPRYSTGSFLAAGTSTTTRWPRGIPLSKPPGNA